jgi:Kef-type K+ transport system membrane component KefB
MLIELALALILAKIMDEVFIRKKQPPVIGEILVGILFAGIAFILPQSIIVGDYSFPLTFDIKHPAFDFFAETGILLLLFLSGMETNLSDLKKSSKGGMLTGALGVLITFLFVFIFVFFLMGFGIQGSIVVATIFTATSVGVTVRTMMELGILNTKVGNTILTAAVADDVFGIILVTVVLSTGDLIALSIGLAAFFLGLYIVYKYNLMEKVMYSTDKNLHAQYSLIAISLGLMFLFAFFADLADIATITGAFFVGLFIGQSRTVRKIIEPIKIIGYALFIPLFFVKVGTLVDFHNLGYFNFALLGIIPMVFLGKIIGCSLGAKLGGVPGKDSFRVGVGMVPEMEVALIIATLVYGSGMFPETTGTGIITTTIIYVIISSITVPLLLKHLYRGKSSASAA